MMRSLMAAALLSACGPRPATCETAGAYFSNLEPGSDECAEYVRVWDLASATLGGPTVRPGTAWRIGVKDWPWRQVTGQMVSGEIWPSGVIIIARFPWADMTEEAARAMPLRRRACASALAHEHRHAAEAPAVNYAHVGWEQNFLALQAFELFCGHGEVETWEG
jgi:hypothetical protein